MNNYAFEQNWWQKLMSYFKGYPVWLVEFGLATALGFVAGFFVKNFGKYIVFIAATLVVAAYVLSYFNLATFHIPQMKQFFGVVEIPSFDIFIQLLITWARNNMTICVGGIIGFMFGWGIAK